MEYISKLKNIRHEIAKTGFVKIKDSSMVTILISGMLESYKHFLETLQIIDKLENVIFDKLSDCQPIMRKSLKWWEILVASTSKNTTKVSNGKGLFPNKGNGNPKNLNQCSNRGKGWG